LSLVVFYEAGNTVLQRSRELLQQYAPSETLTHTPCLSARPKASSSICSCV